MGGYRKNEQKISDGRVTLYQSERTTTKHG
jgi:hypothetical protein